MKRKTLIEQVEDLMAEIYGYAADEHNLNVATNDHSDERYLTAYNLMVDVLNTIEGTSK